MDFKPVANSGRVLARAFIGTSFILMIITSTLVTARIWTRLYPAFRVSWDDLFAVVSYCCVITTTVLLLQTVKHDFGNKDTTKLSLQDFQDAFMFAVIAEIFWMLGIAFTKLSVAFMLLRFEQARYMRNFLWFFVGVLVVVCILSVLSQALQCIPLRAAWDFTIRPKAKCLSMEAQGGIAIAINCINVITDVLFALLPISFLRKVQLPLRERIILGVLMGLGLFAGIVAAVKTYYLTRFFVGNPIINAIRVGFLSSTEALLALATCCIPCLRALFQRILERFGLASPRPPHNDSSYDGGISTSRSRTRKTTSTASGINMNNLMRGDDNRSETRALTESDEEDNTYENVWQSTQRQVQREVEELERIRRGHTRALPPADSVEALDTYQEGPSPTLSTKKKRLRISSWDQNEGEEPGGSSSKKGAGKWWSKI
ncbi:unnamed protein product [Periconia digitata]|uniref:Rhodopsin domain-containing protein n=1 Tax=Periconia digitata TaxID=1303443 RepID=A0A9W4UE08_9PLEO|nr:unnamed protein product [Periconia digitata]